MDKLTQKESFEAAKLVHAKKELPQPEDDKPFKVDDKPFKLNDRVRVFNKDGNPCKGTVRSIKKDILGIETVSCVCREKYSVGLAEVSRCNVLCVCSLCLLTF